MADRGRIRDTYAAALQHGLVDLDGDECLVGVVRRPMPWFAGQVDENLPALGPPPDLLDEFHERRDRLEERGLSDAAAHNRALEEIDYEARYLAHLEESPAAREALRRLEDRLSEGEDLVLVCYENTDEKRCHRTLLVDTLSESDTSPGWEDEPNPGG